MTDHKFTDEEVIKALECCILRKQYRCENRKCPLYYETTKYSDCTEMLVENALDLINRQKAEIERLRSQLDCYEETSGNKQAKAEAIKEFAERLKRDAFLPLGTYFVEEIITAKQIDNLVKEMTEGKT